MPYQAFKDLTRNLNETLNIIPVLYGSLGLERATGIDFQPQDIDVLVPLVFLEKKWDKLKALMESLGYELVDLHEHEFKKQNIKVGIAFIEDLKKFADVDHNHLHKVEDHGAVYFVLSISDYLKVYKKSLLDGYRQTKKDKQDKKKIEILEKLVYKSEMKRD